MPDTRNPLEWAETMLIPFLQGIPEERRAGVMTDRELLYELADWFQKGLYMAHRAWFITRKNYDRHDATPE